MCLTGFPDAIQSVFPKTDVQLCIVHQIRNSVKYVGSKNQKEFLSDLKLVYGASTSETGSILCDKFNVFYGFVWKNEIKFVPLPRQERTRWQDPIIYCSQPFYTKNFLGQFNDCQYWCGDVNAPVVLPHAIHQKTIKKVAGIKGKVDYNILNCKLKEIQL